MPPILSEAFAPAAIGKPDSTNATATSSSPQSLPRRRGPVRGPDDPPTPDDPFTGGRLTSAQADDDALYKPINRAMVLRLMGCMRPLARGYALVVGLGLALSMGEALVPRLVQHLIDHDIPGGTMTAVGQTSAVWAALAGLMLVLQGWQIALATRYGETVLCQLRLDLFGHLQRLDMAFYDRTHMGRILARMGSDLDGLRGVLVWGLNTLFVNAATMTAAGVMMLATDWRLFVSIAWLAPVLWAVNSVYRRRVGAAWQRTRLHFTRLSTNQAENITGMRVVAAFNRQARNLDGFDDLQQTNTANNMAAVQVNGIYQPLLQGIRFAGQAVIIIYGGWRVQTGGLTAGEVVAVFLYWEMFMTPVIGFGTFFNEIMMAMAGAERVFALRDRPPAITDAPGTPDLPVLRGHVRFEAVTFGYEPDRPVLHGIDFEAVPRGVTALVGSTGSGKSTIISLLCRFYEPQSGRILLDGYDITRHTAASLHRQVGLVLQTNYLFTGTVMDNLRYARPQARDEEVIAAAKALGCHDVFSRLKDGYATTVGERGASLSLGERQLVCFTRALIADPRILLLDEATSAVDAGTELIVQHALSRLVADRTTLVVAHRLSTIVNAERILVLDGGRIVERGCHEILLAQGGRYAELYRQFTAHNA